MRVRPRATALPLAFLGLFFVAPLVTILLRAFADGGRPLVDVVTSGRTAAVVWFTLWQAVVSALVTLAVGLPLTALVTRAAFPGRAALRAVATAPFVLPTVVVASAFLALFEVTGLDAGALRLPGTVWAVVAAHVYFNLAVVVRVVGVAWAQLDPRTESAARVLGASPWRAFREVTLPRLARSVATAGAAVFLFSFSSFGVVLLLGGPGRATLDTEIWRYATQRTDIETAAALGLVQLLVVGAILVAASRVRSGADGAEQLTFAPTNTQGRRRVLAAVAGATATAVLALPLLVMVGRSLRVDGRWSTANYRALARVTEGTGLTEAPLRAVGTSLLWGTLAALVAVAIGALASSPTPRRRMLDILVVLPLGTSAVLLGFGMLITLDRPPVDWRSSWWIVPVAHALIGLPFVVGTLRPARAAIASHQREAAAVLGAGPRRVWWEIDVPVMTRALTVGAGFAFAVSVGEFGASAFLVRPQRPTATTTIFRLLGRPGDLAYGQALALSVVLAAVTMGAITAVERVRVSVGRDG